jgi:TrmH family RNA methyltransferase
VPITTVSPAVFQKLAYGEREDGILLVAVPPQRELSELTLPKNVLVAVLEGVEKPGNVGAVLRSADAAGVSAVLLADCATDVFNPNCIRASLGTVFTMPVVETTGQAALEWLRDHHFSIYAARVDGSQDYRQVKMSRPAAMVLGRESAGLSNIWQADDVLPIRLPMRGVVDSLNVSVTAAVLFYEALRQSGND